MSGFEIAGIVLGGFPILIEGAKLLSKHFKRIDRWWNFEREFMGFIRKLETESTSYSQNLGVFLAPVNIDPQVKAQLQNNPSSELWHDPTIQPELVARINSTYLPWFRTQLHEMNEILGKIFSILPITRNGEVAFPSNRAAHELYRIKFSFTSQINPLLDNMVAINDGLDKFLRKESYIHTEATRSANSWSQAPSNVTRLPRAQALLELQSEARKLSCALQQRWNCLCSSHRCGIGLGWNTPEAGRFEKPSLRLQLENEAVLKTTIARSRTDGDLEPSGATSDSDIATVEQVTNLRRQARRRFEPTMAERRAEEPGFFSGLGTMTSLLLGVAAPTEWDRASTSARSSPRRSHVSLSTPPAPSSLPGAQISDTCSFLQTGPSWAENSYLKAEQDTVVFSIQPREQANFRDWGGEEELEMFCCTTPRLPDRLQIGLQISLTILGLGTSCWLPRGWDRRDLFVLRSAKTPTMPFVEHESLSFSLNESVGNIRTRTKDSLFSLGVLLLELTYQEKVEQQPFWDTYCDNGQPNDWTLQMTAMRWQSQVEARYGDNLSKLIQRCVETRFLKDANLDDSEFLQEVIDTVVSPLQRFLDGWNSV